MGLNKLHSELNLPHHINNFSSQFELLCQDYFPFIVSALLCHRCTANTAQRKIPCHGPKHQLGRVRSRKASCPDRLDRGTTRRKPCYFLEKLPLELHEEIYKLLLIDVNDVLARPHEFVSLYADPESELVVLNMAYSQPFSQPVGKSARRLVLCFMG